MTELYFVQGAAWVAHLSENLGLEGVKLQTATKGVEDMQAKLNALTAERDQAMERANGADQALAVERSLKDQLAAQTATKDGKIKELEDRLSRVGDQEKLIKELREKLESTEQEKKEAEELAKRAQVDNFRLGYDDAVAQAKQFGLDYKKLLLNPEVDTTLEVLEPEGGDETPEAGSQLNQ